MVSFDNTEIAFLQKNNSELHRAKFVFMLVSYPFIVKIGKSLFKFLIKINFPLHWVYKPLLYRQFVGGESIEGCERVIKLLADQNVKTILDYPIEQRETISSQEKAYDEILKSVTYSATHPNLAFSVFKPSALIDVNILAALSDSGTLENPEDVKKIDLFRARVDNLCKSAYNINRPILIDAELTWIQKAIDSIVEEMMAKYNKDRAIVYNTFQMYRTDRLDFLIKAHKRAVKSGYILGAKIVRGAYMEIERQRAEKMGITSPIHETKQDTDRDFNEALKYISMNIDTVSLFCGTHNEDSINYLTCLMDSYSIPVCDSKVFFSQLYGMSDNISFNLAESNYNVAKYVPYGPVNAVIPYLIRRAEENTSVLGQTSRELKYIRMEIKDRKRRKSQPIK